MSIGTVLALSFTALLVYFLARAFPRQFRMALAFVLRMCGGAVLLLAVNLVARIFGASLALNPYTALIAGYMNLPGVILLFLIQYWLAP